MVWQYQFAASQLISGLHCVLTCLVGRTYARRGAVQAEFQSSRNHQVFPALCVWVYDHCERCTPPSDPAMVQRPL